MFARTSRLLLRPGWAQDAPALALAMAGERVCREHWSAPWPFSLRDAEAALAAPCQPSLPHLLIFERTSGEPRLVGSCGLRRRPSGAVELFIWIVRDQRSRGLASEACRALLETARTLGIAQIEAAHFEDSLAASRLLARLGFRTTGLTALRQGGTERGDAPMRLMRARLRPRQAVTPLAA
jgi:RimJ/RimL family protein N-acetyltransferase